MKQYIVTIELWRNGVAEIWQQAALECRQHMCAEDILDEIRKKFSKDGYSVKITAIFSL